MQLLVHNYLTDVRDDLFEGCIICAAGASSKQKSLVKSLVERYDENVDTCRHCSHLLVWKLEGTRIILSLQIHLIVFSYINRE